AAIKVRALDFRPTDGNGCHDRFGIMLGAGPGSSSMVLPRASICDIAPTLLALMGIRIPAGSVGRVMHDAFPGLAGQAEQLVSDFADTELPLRTSDVDPDEVTRRPRALGCLDRFEGEERIVST